MKINVEIDNKNGYYYLKSGNECHFRHFMTALFLQTCYIDEILKQKELQYLEIVITNFFNYFDSLTDTTEKSFFMIYYKISLLREKQGFPGPFSSDIGVMEEIDRIRAMDPDVAIDHLYRIHGGILKMILPKKENTEKITELKDALIKALNFDLDPKEDKILYILCADAFTSINFYPYQVASLFDRFHYFALLFKKQNSELYGIIEKTINQFAQVNDVVYNLSLDYFIYYLNLYFDAQLQHQQEISILVISELGEEHSNFVTKFITNHFSYCKVSTRNLHPLPFSRGSIEFNEKDHDLILSTAVLENLESEQYILINDYGSVKFSVVSHNETCKV